MITIAGGTGLVGKHLTDALLREGTHAFGEGKVEIAGVDFDDSKTLRDAFKGSDRAFLSMGASDRQVRDEIALIDAATDAGVALPGEPVDRRGGATRSSQCPRMA